MAGHIIGYARVSTSEQDLTAQRNGLAALNVTADRIYVDHGLTGTNRDRPGLREALAACRAGDTVVFSSCLHGRPRNSGVVQTSMDIETSEVPCTEVHSAQ